MHPARIAALFAVTAIAEIVGCYLPYLWLRQGKSPWLLIPAAISLMVFTWLLTLHPTAAGRVYAAYGGVYVTMALFWLWLIDCVRPGLTDLIGVALCLCGMAVIMFSNRHDSLEALAEAIDGGGQARVAGGAAEVQTRLPE